MAEVTIMVLKVDLNCCKCYKKVRKLLCKFHEIQDTVYDEKQNTVTIKVVSCCPERLQQKIWCKGGKSIKSIEIKPPPKKPNPVEKNDDEKPQPPDKTTKETPKKYCPPIEVFINLPKPEKKPPQPAPYYAPCYGHPIPPGVCCRDCYEGRGGGPCQQLGYVCRYPCYCGCNRGYHRSYVL